MPIRLDQLKKLEASSIPPLAVRSEDEPVEVIVKVRKAQASPPGITVRSWIDPHLFTCEIPVSELATLERDPNVVSVAVGKKLRNGG